MDNTLIRFVDLVPFFCLFRLLPVLVIGLVWLNETSLFLKISLWNFYFLIKFFEFAFILLWPIGLEILNGEEQRQCPSWSGYNWNSDSAGMYYHFYIYR